MRAKDARELRFQTRVIQDGEHYEKKPFGAKTVKQLLQMERKPISEDAIEYFEMPYTRNGKREAYAYVREENSVPFDKEDILDMEKALEQRKEEKLFQKENRALEKANKKALEKEQKKHDLLLLAAASFAKNVVVFDTETTGFSAARGDELLQISIADKNGTLLFDTYVKPLRKTSWWESQKVHGISPEMVKNSPNKYEIVDKVKELLLGADVVVGHNVSFDLRFVKEYLGIEIEKDSVVDTLALYKADAPEEESYILENAVKRYCPYFYERFVEGAHDSSVDTMATGRVFKAIADKGMELAKEEGIDLFKESPNNKEDLQSSSPSLLDAPMEEDADYNDKHKAVDPKEEEEDFSYFEIG